MTEPIDSARRQRDGHTNPGHDRAAATPASMNTATKPLEAVLSGSGHDPTRYAATLWPHSQVADTSTHAGAAR